MQGTININIIHHVWGECLQDDGERQPTRHNSGQSMPKEATFTTRTRAHTRTNKQSNQSLISPGSVLVPGGSCWDPALALANFTHGLISTQHRCPLGTQLQLPWQCRLLGPRKCQMSKQANLGSHGCASHSKQTTLAQYLMQSLQFPSSLPFLVILLLKLCLKE